MRMSRTLNYEQALELLKRYNKDEFHIRYALIVSGVMVISWRNKTRQ